MSAAEKLKEAVEAWAAAEAPAVAERAKEFNKNAVNKNSFYQPYKRNEDVDSIAATLFSKWWDDWYSSGQERELPGGKVTCVEQFGGEGQGDHQHVVVEFNGVLLKNETYYSSWDDADWDWYNVHEVKPVEKTIVVYERV